MRAKIKAPGDLFKADDRRQVVITVGEMKAAFEKEYNARQADVFEACKRDITAQLMATCLVALNKEFGFGKKRLNQFKVSVEALFVAMVGGGIMGQEFSTQNCIDLMRDRYGIDVDTDHGED